MKQASDLFQNYEIKKTNLNERSSLLKQFQDEINKERPYTYKNSKGKKVKVNKITGKELALRVAHVKTEDLYYFLSVCRDEKNRKGSFSKCFFGRLKK